ncbi:unnamed protein product [Boreogadus saida]
MKMNCKLTEDFRHHCIPACISAHSDHTPMSRMQHSSDGDVEFYKPSLDFMIFLRSAQVEETLELYKVKKVTCSLSQGVCLLTQSKTSTSSPRARPPPPHPEPDLHLLTQSQTSTSSPRARPPPPHPEPDLHLLSDVLQNRSVLCLKGEAERLGTGGLWCQGGPETEAGDQGPAAPDQMTRTLSEESCWRS